MSNRLIRLYVVVTLIAPCLPASADSTRDAVTATRIRDQLNVELVGGELVYGVDNRQPTRKFSKDQVFVADEAIYLTYKNLDPLSVSVISSVTEAEDPSHRALAKLIEALVSVPATVRPETAEAIKKHGFATADIPPDRVQALTDTCPAATANLKLVTDLYDALFPTGTTKEEFDNNIKAWRTAIAGDPGAAGVAKAKIAVGTLRGAIRLEVAEERLKAFEAKVNDVKGVAPADDCGKLAKAIIMNAALANPRTRLEGLTKIAAVLDELKTALTPFADAGNWLVQTVSVGSTAPPVHYYKLLHIAPSEVKIKTIQIKVSKIDYTLGSNALVVTRTDAAAVTLALRERRSLIPELGVGVAFVSGITKPKYGTARNAAGATTVALSKRENIGLDASVLANLVMRINLGIGAPMLQLGATASKDTPGILMGGGLRLFYPKAFGFGFGWARVWVKDLTLLHEGDVIQGTKDIEADLSFKTVDGLYLVFQYSF